jgi:peroxiredoxin
VTSHSLEESTPKVVTPPTQRWRSLIIGLILILGGAWFIGSRLFLDRNSAGQIAGVAPVALVGEPAPDFTLKNLAGETVRLSDFKGQPVLLNFWATWCAPCRKEFPELQATWEKKRGSLVVIGVNYTSADTPDLVPGFVEEMGITFPVVLDETGQTSETYRILGMPTSIFIDRTGVVREVFTGPLDQAYIEAKLSEL